MPAVAVVDESGAVVNVIIADPEQDALPGYALIAIPDGMSVDQRWVWSEAEGFHPGPELQAEIDARAAAIEREGLAFDD